MKSKIKAFIKNNKLFYRLYYLMGSFFLRVLGVFIKTDPNLLLFVCYGGRKFDDSPRVVYEYLQEKPVSKDHRYVWAFTEPEKYPDIKDSVKIDTFSYYITALRAGYWITNSSVSRGLNFKKKATKNILFTHGLTAIKRIGSDVPSSGDAFVTAFHETFDMVFVEGRKEVPILATGWKVPESVFHMTGLPRNDDLVGATKAECENIKCHLGIPKDKKVILYAPTFRDNARSADGRHALGIPMDLNMWKKHLGTEYVLLITAHYEVAKLLDSLPDNGFVINAFGYPELNDLLKVADILISDYSSIVFDYAILERPIYCYGYDYENYLVQRGSYTDINQLFCDGVIRNEETLRDKILHIDYDAQCLFTKRYIKEKYIASYGDAARKSVEIIFGQKK